MSQDEVDFIEQRIGGMRTILRGFVPSDHLDVAADFLAKLLHVDPALRCTLTDALHHPFVLER